MGYNFVADNIRLAVMLTPKSVKSREIPPEFEVIAVKGHPTSSISVAIESAYATSY